MPPIEAGTESRFQHIYSSLASYEKKLTELQQNLKSSEEYSQRVNAALDSAKKELSDRINVVDQKATSGKTLADKLRDDFARAEELKKALNKVCRSPIFPRRPLFF